MALKSTDEPLSLTYRLALLDLDGVVYRGKNPVPRAAENIRTAEAFGMTIEYTTNNSSRMQATVADQLRGFDLDVEPHQVITSSVVAARMVAKACTPGAKVLVLGAEHLRDEVGKQGLVVVDGLEDPVALAGDDDPATASGIEAAIQGWYPEMTWNQMAQVAYAVEAGARYYVTNRDLTIPRELGIAPGCGSMIQAVVNATGVEPVSSAGKPESAMYDEARELAAAPGEDLVSVAQSLAIGDRLDTDIEAGNRGGYDSLCVLTGVTSPAMLMTAPPKLRPTYISLDLDGLNDPAPAVARDAGSGSLDSGMDGVSWTCRDARATFVAADRAVVVSDAHSVDGLRAACALCWELADAGLDVAALTLPEFILEPND
ncbi:HAD-IIA family hydrolase [Bifidobacterium choloepi]|uniref:HAD-IIA family hydrolase n=1 Tax=Bifidobacterium choloepi TaxID=2614131 RepID=A0A6I5N0X9_9BIFI|nr:HAD-IIA family hydrolase [Bifidobacterium choloepi]NEG70247.1 HAD-IIA family hydrolase [Bifidobacterium choloepi]